MAETGPMSMCPMSGMCRRMMDRTGSGFWMIIPGVLFIVLGVLIMMYPQILAWFIAIMLILMGVGMLMMINFMRGSGKEIQNRTL